MEDIIIKNPCFTCDKQRITFYCNGCSKDFCRNDLIEHFRFLNEQLNEMTKDYEQFQEYVNNQKQNTNERLLIQEVNKWEENSIEKIQQIAEKYRMKIIKYTDRSLIEIEKNLNELIKQIEEIRCENDFNEMDLDQLREKLNKLKEEVDRPSKISIKQQFSTFINKISVAVAIEKDTKWTQNGMTITEVNAWDNPTHELRCPQGIVIDDEIVYIVDHGNHRVVQWQLNILESRIVAGGNGKGKRSNQLNLPVDLIIDKQKNSLIISDYGNRRVTRWPLQNNYTNSGQTILANIDCYGLTMNKNGDLYVCDHEKDEVRIWKTGDKEGRIVAGGNGKGGRLNQFNYPTYIFVDNTGSLYISDCYNHRVMKWIKDAKEGIIVAGGNDQGDSLKQLCRPHGVIVDRLGQIYVADYGNDRVMRWCEGETEGTIIVGGNGEGKQSNQLSGPCGLSFDREGNLCVVDHWNHRTQKFGID